MGQFIMFPFDDDQYVCCHYVNDVYHAPAYAPGNILYLGEYTANSDNYHFKLYNALGNYSDDLTFNGDAGKNFVTELGNNFAGLMEVNTDDVVIKPYDRALPNTLDDMYFVV